MILLKTIFICCSILIGLIGCVSGNNRYDQPGSYQKENSRVFSLPKETLWKKLVPAISKSFFSINTIDRESGLVNLTFSANPEKYVDCGYQHSTVQNARGKRDYSIKLSSSGSRYEMVGSENDIFQFHRTLALDGKINLVVEAIEASKTKVSVNTKYVLTRKATAIGGRDANYRPLQHNFLDSISFEINSDARFPNAGTSCLATGAPENEVLDLIPLK